MSAVDPGDERSSNDRNGCELRCDPCGAARGAAATQGYPYQDIISGAGHDACYIARVAPTQPNEIEDAKPEDPTAGGNVLLNVVLGCANAAASGEPG